MKYFDKQRQETVLDNLTQRQKMNGKIQAVTHNDIDELKKVVDSSGLFPSEYLDEMISDYLNNADTQDIWFTYIDDNTPKAIGYCVPEKLTNGTYNLLAIGESKDSQRNGVATEMMSYIEQQLKQKDGRILIVETSSDDAQIDARKFL
jgi:ribosomal protein S18 acetylase RimI-like enzyme